MPTAPSPSAKPIIAGSFSGLDELPDAAAVVDADGVLVWANPMLWRLLRTTDLLGQPAREVIDLRTADDLDWWDTDPLGTDPTLIRRMAEQELVLRRDRTTHVVAVTASRLRGDAVPGGLLMVLRRADARRRRDVARSDLVSTVSHELRAPLTSVKGFTKTLLSKWDRFSDDQRRQMLATVNEDADRVTRLLGELLAVSRIDAGRLALRRQMVRLDVLVPRVVNGIQAGAGQGRTITVSHDNPPELYADPDRLDQVLTNLVENAVKYTDDEILIDVTTGQDTVQVTVADRGPGIEPEFRTAIFTKFFRRPGEKRQGTGLGLYITKGLVEAHGGEIWAEDGEDEGSVFRFTLPQGGLELSGIDFHALRASTTKTSTTTNTSTTHRES